MSKENEYLTGYVNSQLVLATRKQLFAEVARLRQADIFEDSLSRSMRLYELQYNLDALKNSHGMSSSPVPA